MPSAISRPSEHVEMASTSTAFSFWPRRMMEPLPQFRSICEIAASSAFSLSISPPSTRRSATFNMADSPLFHRPGDAGKRRFSMIPGADRPNFGASHESERSMYTFCSLFAIRSFLCTWSREVAVVPILGPRWASHWRPSGGAGRGAPALRRQAGSLAAVAGEAMGRMPRIAAAILPAHISDGGVGMLGLHFERGNQRVLRIDGDAVGFALRDEAHGVMTRHVLNLPRASIVIARPLVMPGETSAE